MNKDDKIRQLWDITADEIIRQMTDQNIPPSAGVLQCALRFLQDNNAGALNVPEGKQEQIKKLLPFPKLKKESA